MADPQNTPASHYFWCPSYLTDDMIEAGQRALSRAREDGTAGMNSLAYAYAMAALDSANQGELLPVTVNADYRLAPGEPAAAKEPDWSHSETLLSELWKNPLLPMTERLIIADGAIAWRQKVIANLRTRLTAVSASQEPWGYAIDVAGYGRLLEQTASAAGTQEAYFRSRGREVTVTALVPAGSAVKPLPEDVDSRPEERGEPEPRYHPVLSAGEMAWLRRFFSACGASGRAPADLPHGAVIQLEHAGVLRRSGDGRHEITRFGEYVLNEEV